MSEPLIDESTIEHLDWTPVCESKWHEEENTERGEATHHAKSACRCRQALLCKDCVERIARAASLEVVYRCRVCGEHYPAFAVRLMPL